MALNVKITQKTGSANFYYLQAERVRHMYTRIPKLIALPATADTAPTNKTIDYGECLQQFQITGTIENDADLVNNIPAKSTMETVIKEWWGRGNDAAELPVLSVLGVTYTVSIKSASFRQHGAIQDRWDYDMLFYVKA